MKFATFNLDGTIEGAHNNEMLDQLPDGALELTDEQFAQSTNLRRTADGLSVEFFTPVLPAPSLEMQREAINKQRDAGLVAGVAHDGKLYHTDDRFLTELLGMILGYNAGVYSGTQDIRTRDNEIVAMNAAQIVALASAVGAHRRAVYAASWAAKDAL